MLLSCAAAHAQQRYWYDGEQRRALWAEASVVADFSVRSAEKSQVLKPASLDKERCLVALAGVSRRQGAHGRDARAARRVILRFHPSATDASVSS